MRIAKRLFSIFHDVTQKNFICTIVFRCESNYVSIFTLHRRSGHGLRYFRNIILVLKTRKKRFLMVKTKTSKKRCKTYITGIKIKSIVALVRFLLSLTIYNMLNLSSL